MTPPPPPRVAYILSSSLIQCSDQLPSNLGRSTLVHSLTYHLDLLDLSLLNDDHDNSSDDDKNSDSSSSQDGDDSFPLSLSPDKSVGQENEYTALLRRLGGDPHTERVKTRGGNDGRNRALVYPPHRASRRDLEVYHDSKFVERLLRGHLDDGDDDAAPSKGHDGSDSDSVSNAEQDDEEEVQLRPSSHVAGIKRKRGYNRPPSRTNNHFGLLDDCPSFPALKDHVELIAGASIRAAELVASGEADIAIAWDGGRHHAKKDAASGFCYVNDAVLAILSLRKLRKRRVPVHPPSPSSSSSPATATATATASATGDQEAPSTPPPVRYKTVMTRMERILYLDLDLHWGDGVEEAFYTSPSVLTLSLHHYAPGFFPCYATARSSSGAAEDGGGGGGGGGGPPGSLECQGGPASGAAASHALSLPLLPGASGQTLLRVLKEDVERIVMAFQPDCLVLQLGLDGLADDPMGVWNLSGSSVLEALSLILGWVRQLSPSPPSSTAGREEGEKGKGEGCKLLLLGGGGYENSNTAKVWACITALVLGRWRGGGEGEGGGGGGDGAKAEEEEEGEEGTASVHPSSGDALGDNGEKAWKERKEKEGGWINANTTIPHSCPSWPAFGGRTLDVKAGQMGDSNTPTHFDALSRVVRRHVDVLSSQQRR